MKKKGKVDTFGYIKSYYTVYRLGIMKYVYLLFDNVFTNEMIRLIDVLHCCLE